MYLRINRSDWVRPFDKARHYRALELAHHRMTDEGLGGGSRHGPCTRCRKEAIPKGYLDQDFRLVPETWSLHETGYVMEDSLHNHLRIDGDSVLHRKGSTELLPGKTVVIPLSMSRGSLLVRSGDEAGLRQALYSCSHGAGRMRSRYAAMNYWRTTLKEKQRRLCRERFAELLGRNGEFPSGYIQEFDFAYKDCGDLLAEQPYLRLVAQTRPVVTVKYTEI